jgi:hypothetical protein
MMAQNESVGDHLALGVPQMDFMEADVCQLIQKDYIMGYSHQHHMPLWSAARLSKNVTVYSDISSVAKVINDELLDLPY